MSERKDSRRPETADCQPRDENNRYKHKEADEAEEAADDAETAAPAVAALALNYLRSDCRLGCWCIHVYGLSDMPPSYTSLSAVQGVGFVCVLSSRRCLLALRKLYTVAYITFQLNKVSDVVIGFTVARSDDEVTRIVRARVPPSKKFTIYKATAGSYDPEIARREAQVLIAHDFEWLDPRPPAERDAEHSIPALVVRLLTRDIAL